MFQICKFLVAESSPLIVIYVGSHWRPTALRSKAQERAAHVEEGCVSQACVALTWTGPLRAREREGKKAPATSHRHRRSRQRGQEALCESCSPFLSHRPHSAAEELLRMLMT